MKIRALCSFSGQIAMAKGEVRECGNEYVINDLLKAGYVEVLEKPSPAEKTDNSPKKRTTRKRAVTDHENQ